MVADAVLDKEYVITFGLVGAYLLTINQEGETNWPGFWPSFLVERGYRYRSRHLQWGMLYISP